MRCEPARKLKVIEEPCDEKKLMDQIDRGLFRKGKRKGEGVSILQMPMINGKNSFVIEIQETVPLETKNFSHHPKLRSVWQKTSMSLAGNHVGSVLEMLNKKSKQKFATFMPWYLKNVVPVFTVPEKTSVSIGPFPEMMTRRNHFTAKISMAAYYIPIKKDNRARIQDVINCVSNLRETYHEQGKFPVVHGIYYRYLKGTNGGLSPSFHNEDEDILVVDVTSDWRVEGWHEFADKLGTY